MRILTLLAFLIAGVSGAAAQDFRGAITGRVNDRSGAVLPGVAVTATNVASEGLFTIPYLTPGNYTVVAELSGFKKAVREGLEVRVGDRLVVDMSLEVGQLEETVLAGNRVRPQFHAEFLNAFNRVVYANPNTDPRSSDFGKVTSQNTCRATSSSRSS